MNFGKCSCKYSNPIEYVCILKKCKAKRLFCQSYAWNHREHQHQVKQINEFESLITNDCLVQRIQSVQNAEGITHSIDSIVEAAQQDILKILKKRCQVLKDKVQKEYNPFNQTLQHITSITKKNYTIDTIEYLVNELDFEDLNSQLQSMEAAQYKKFHLICKEIVNLVDALNKVRTVCQEQSSSELNGIKANIDMNLDPQSLVSARSINLDQLVSLAQYQKLNNAFIDQPEKFSTQIKLQSHANQEYQSEGSNKKIPYNYNPLTEYNSNQFQSIKRKLEAEEKEPNQKIERLKTEHVHQQSCKDFSFFNLNSVKEEIRKSRREELIPPLISNRVQPQQKRQPSKSLYDQKK